MANHLAGIIICVVSKKHMSSAMTGCACVLQYCPIGPNPDRERTACRYSFLRVGVCFYGGSGAVAAPRRDQKSRAWTLGALGTLISPTCSAVVNRSIIIGIATVC